MSDSVSIEGLGVDIAAQMYEALTTEAADTSIVEDAAVKLKQIRYIKKYINTLGVEDRREVGQIIAQYHGYDMLKPCAEGSVVDSDSLSAEAVNAICAAMSKKVSTFTSIQD